MLPKLRTRTSLPILIDEFLNDSMIPRFFNWETSQSVPAVNITEGKEDFRIEVAAPGLDKEDFKISLDNNVMNISSEKEDKTESEDENVLRREFSYSAFRRSFTLPATVNGDKIKATHNDGILTIVIPKKEEAKVKPVREIKIT
jgi:HSP20 family protein